MLLAGALLAGCGGDPVASLYADYHARLSRVTGVDVPEDALRVEALRYPRGRERQLPVPEVEGGLLDIFRLKRCGVAELVAERNSILGRHADAATHLAIGGLVAHRLDRCRETLETGVEENAEFAARLKEMLAQKEKALSAHTWNATLGHQAMADWWSPSGGALDLAEPDMPGDGLEKLAVAVTAGLDGERDRADAAFSAAYQQLERQRYGGSWVRAVRTSLAGMATASEILEAVDSHRLCPQQRPTPKARVLQTILQQRYFAHIQPLLAALDRAGEAMHEPLESIRGRIEARAPAVSQFREQVWAATPESLRGRLMTATRNHAEAWQHALAPCGLGPEKSAGR